MQFSFIWPIGRILWGATTPGQSGPGSVGNKGVLCIPQSANIAEAATSDCLMSYPGHPLGMEVLPLCKGAGYEFYIPSRLGKC